MREVKRNDKAHQRERLTAEKEAQDALAQLHELLARPGRRGLRVGQMVKVAARLGLLEGRGLGERPGPAGRSR